MSMSSKTLLALAVLVCAAAVTFVGVQRSRGLGQFVVSDVTSPVQKAIKAPIFPFRNGAMFVAADGQLDGDATLQITSNHGRDHRTEVLSGTIQGKVFGGAEAWVDDLVVSFEPGSAKQGHVSIRMACGKNLK